MSTKTMKRGDDVLLEDGRIATITEAGPRWAPGTMWAEVDGQHVPVHKTKRTVIEPTHQPVACRDLDAVLRGDLQLMQILKPRRHYSRDVARYEVHEIRCACVHDGEVPRWDGGPVEKVRSYGAGRLPQLIARGGCLS